MSAPRFERRGTRPDRRKPWQPRGAALLMPDPKPNEAAEFWRTACWMLAVFSLVVGGALGFGIGQTYNRDGHQAELDAETYRKQAIERDSVADACGEAFDRLSYDATLALNYARYWAAWAETAGEYADSLRAEPPREYVAEAPWSGDR